MQFKSKRHIQPEDRVPFHSKLAYGAGAPVEWLVVGLVTSVLWMPVFNIGFGIAPSVLGMLLGIFRLWDAVLDPVMGNISDNTRTRWGRRRPYIVAGAILTAVCYIFLWRPPAALGETGTIAYLTVAGLILFSAFTVWAMPYYSMMLEMTPDYDERTHVTAYRTFFSKFAILAGAWVLAIASSSLFADPATGEPNLVRGVQVVSLFIAAMILCLGGLPGIFVKERYYEKAAKKQEKTPILKAMRDTLSLKPFWILVGFVFFKVFGGGVIAQLGFYVNTYYVNDGNLGAATIIEGWKGTTLFAFGIGSIPLWTWLCEKLDKKICMILILIGGFIGSALNWVCVRPDMPYLQLVPVAFTAAVSGALWLIVPSMQADIVDYDELKNAKRREGSHNAMFSWFLKLAFTIAAMLSGFVLEWTGFDVALKANQSPDVMRAMLLWWVLLPILFWSISILLVSLYPLNRKKMHTIRTQLEARRGAL